jgi:hypothetical protein
MPWKIRRADILIDGGPLRAPLAKPALSKFTSSCLLEGLPAQRDERCPSRFRCLHAAHKRCASRSPVRCPLFTVANAKTAGIRFALELRHHSIIRSGDCCTTGGVPLLATDVFFSVLIVMRTFLQRIGLNGLRVV